MKKRVLIVEDEVLVAMLLEELLERMGYEVAAVSSHLEEALGLARTIDVELALLDVNLNGRESFPVAEVLRGRGIPFAFATGYGDSALQGGYARELLVEKPFNRENLKRVLDRL